LVVRHEAMAIRRSRVEGSPLEAEDLSERLPAPGAPVDERAERDERLARSLEALARLKPDERMALLLKARSSGCSRVLVSRRVRRPEPVLRRAFSGLAGRS
jgi:hypothetical protein